jgi:hypothetical protein
MLETGSLGRVLGEEIICRGGKPANRSNEPPVNFGG